MKDRGNIIGIDLGDAKTRVAWSMMEQDGKRSYEIITCPSVKYYEENLLDIETTNKIKDIHESAKDVIVAIPTYLKAQERKKLLEAGKKQGLNVCELINQPTAALYYIDSLNDLSGNVVLVFDLGCSSLNLLAAEISESEIVELAVGGDKKVGGQKWNERLLHFIENQTEFFFKNETTTITRDEFEREIAQLIGQIKEAIHLLMKDLFEIGLFDFDKIILTGAASRMPQIKGLMEELFPCTEILEALYENAVVEGTVLYSECRLGAMNRLSEQKRIRKISSYSYGLAVAFEDDNEKRIQNVIFKGDLLPISVEKVFYTNSDKQKFIQLQVYETTSKERFSLIKEECLLYNCVLELPPQLPKHSSISVKFIMRNDGGVTLEGNIENVEMSIQIK